MEHDEDGVIEALVWNEVNGIIDVNSEGRYNVQLAEWIDNFGESPYTWQFEQTDQYIIYAGSAEEVIIFANDTFTPTIRPCTYFVDLGLPSGNLWAAWNVGADSPTGWGNMYQYGKGMLTYEDSESEPDYDGTENPLSTSQDTAAQTIGGRWRTPTEDDLREVLDNCTWDYVENYQGSGVNGWLFSNNDKSIFIPYAGYIENGMLMHVNEDMLLWTSTPQLSSEAYAMNYADGDFEVGTWERNMGASIRPVMTLD